MLENKYPGNDFDNAIDILFFDEIIKYFHDIIKCRKELDQNS